MNQNPMPWPPFFPRLSQVAVDDHEDPSLCILIDVTISGARAICLIDSGATSSILSDAFRRRVNLASNSPVHKDASLANGSLIKILGSTSPLPTDVSLYEDTQRYHVLPNLDGMDAVDWMIDNGVLIDAPGRRSIIRGPDFKAFNVRARRTVRQFLTTSRESAIPFSCAPSRQAAGQENRCTFNVGTNSTSCMVTSPEEPRRLTMP
jgi:hypothetical protein